MALQNCLLPYSSDRCDHRTWPRTKAAKPRFQHYPMCISSLGGIKTNAKLGPIENADLPSTQPNSRPKEKTEHHDLEPSRIQIPKTASSALTSLSYRGT